MDEQAPTRIAAMDALNALIRERDAGSRAEADFAGFLRGYGVHGDDLAAMEKTGAERYLVYRQLVQNRMRNTVREFIERTAARLGPQRLREDFSDFMHERAAASPYLRDVPSEFTTWVAPRWREDPTVPDYLVDLARHELLEYDVRNDPHGGEKDSGHPLALDLPLRFDGAARLLTYDHAVHKLSYDVADRALPEAVPTRLLVYRDNAFKVRYLELTEFAGATLRSLLEDRLAVADGLRAACESLGFALDDSRLGTAATLLADLSERGVLLGAEPL